MRKFLETIGVVVVGILILATIGAVSIYIVFEVLKGLAH